MTSSTAPTSPKSSSPASQQEDLAKEVKALAEKVAQQAYDLGKAFQTIHDLETQVRNQTRQLELLGKKN